MYFTLMGAGVGKVLRADVIGAALFLFICLQAVTLHYSIMKWLPLIFLFCGACSVPAVSNGDAGSSEERNYATQLTALSPDYRKLLDQPALTNSGPRQRGGNVTLPSDSKAAGQTWKERLEKRGALLGYGLDGKAEDGSIVLIDTGLTEREFDSWVRENGWHVPDHIRWSFVAEMSLPSVGDGAKDKIRIWPASTRRTGMQHQALFSGRVELRDGCFFVSQSGKPADKLAWFHSETGLDVDASGYFILRNRIDGQTLARIGEDMNWAGPASADISEKDKQALIKACGLHEIFVVGSPEAKQRFLTQYPHMREPAVAPPKSPPNL